MGKHIMKAIGIGVVALVTGGLGWSVYTAMTEVEKLEVRTKVFKKGKELIKRGRNGSITEHPKEAVGK